MKWKSLSKSDAEKEMHLFIQNSKGNYDKDYTEIRTKLQGICVDCINELQISENQIQSAGYKFDLLFGIKLYQYFTNELKMSTRNASDDGVWRFLSLKVVPDIVFLRCGDNGSKFWKVSRRVWLKTLWWYIHLSWQGDYMSTLQALKKNTTDEIVQLVERSGTGGYRVNLYREIMRYYSTIEEGLKKRNLKMFRKVMKLNTARIKVVEPSLMDGGEQKYVKELFRYFGQ